MMKNTIEILKMHNNIFFVTDICQKYLFEQLSVSKVRTINEPIDFIMKYRFMFRLLLKGSI